MVLTGQYALITGSSRGIGRGIALKLAQHDVKVAIHYYEKEATAKETLAKVRECGADGFVIQADVSRSEDISRMFERVRAERYSVDGGGAVGVAGSHWQASGGGGQSVARQDGAEGGRGRSWLVGPAHRGGL